MQSILVVDDIAIIREPIAAALRAAGFQTISAASGTEALLKMRTAAPDLVLLDVSMPGMDGLTVLRQMRATASTAAITVMLLTGSNDKALILQAAKLGICDYMLKSGYTTESLLGRVSKCLARACSLKDPANALKDSAAAVTVQPAKIIEKLTREQIIEKIDSADIQMVSCVLDHLMTLANSPRTTMADVAACLKQDPALSLRILKLANSAAFASRQKIVVIEEAVRHIGLSKVQNIAASMLAMDAIGDTPGNLETMRAWQHSLAVAAIMERLAQQGKNCVPAVAYLVGLFHEFPDMAIRRLFPDHYRSAVSEAVTSDRCHRDVLAEYLGMPFGQIAAMVLARASVPPQILSPIKEFFTAATDAQKPVAHSSLGQLLNIANLCAHAMLLSPGLEETVCPLLLKTCSDAVGTDTVALDFEALRSQTIQTCKMLGGELARSMTPLATQRPLKVAYFCDHERASFDPLRNLLQMLVTEVIDAPIADGLFPSCDAIIVASDHRSTATALTTMHATLPAVTEVLYLTSAWPQSAAPLPRSEVQPIAISVKVLLRFLDRATARL